MIETIVIPIVAVVVAVLITLVAISSMYTVVPPSEAHVVVSRSKGRKVYCTREETTEEGKEQIKYAGSAYWKIPFIQQITIVPLENLQLQVEKIPLRDSNMAKFIGDVVAWVNVSNPLLAAERLGKENTLQSINLDINNSIRAVTRNESMGSTIIDIMKNRKEFSTRVEKAVNTELDEWGMKVVELEVIHFIDEPGYTVIKDLETRQAEIINAETRKIKATQRKDAEIVESTATRESTVIKAKNEKTYREEQIQTQQAIAMREQEKEIQVAEKIKEANEAKVKAAEAETIGMAEIAKQKKIVDADAEAQRIFKEGKAKADVTKETGIAEAEVVKQKGLSEAEIIRQKGFAEAESTDKRADALKKYNEAGIGLETLNAIVQIAGVQAEAWAKAMSNADIKVYGGGNDNGGILSPQAGFNLGAVQEIAKSMGLDINEILKNIGGKTLPVVNANDAVKEVQKKTGK